MSETIATSATASGHIDFAVEHSTRDALRAAAELLSEAHAERSTLDDIATLAGEIGEPCIVAVVGQVNAGKSTFINALLGEDLAVVGNAETTATINHFVYASDGASHVVRCHWRNGGVSQETLAFLDSLQGNDEDTLERAADIDWLEYRLAQEILRGITLVDTPGTGTVVREHTDRTAQFLALERTLRARHAEQTSAIHSRADAIVYLVGAVARQTDQELLSAFAGGAQQDRAMNALGVLAKTDLDDSIFSRRGALSTKIARQLETQLNTVVPVSAALARAAQRIWHASSEDLDAVFTVARSLSAEDLTFLLRNEELFTGVELDGSPCSLEQRRSAWHGQELDWATFRMVMTSAANAPDRQQLALRLGSMAGFDQLRQTLMDHFVIRGKVLRCHRIASQARRVLRRDRFRIVDRVRRQAQLELEQIESFVEYLESQGVADSIVPELIGFLMKNHEVAQAKLLLPDKWRAAEAVIEQCLRDLDDLNQDFLALQQLYRAANDAVDEGEFRELKSLFGGYGTRVDTRLRGETSAATCLERQLFWRLQRDTLPRSAPRWNLANHATARLGDLAAKLMNAPG